MHAETQLYLVLINRQDSSQFINILNINHKGLLITVGIGRTFEWTQIIIIIVIIDITVIEFGMKEEPKKMERKK